jgi:hypothetical protein
MILGHHISKELRDALGLPKHTRGFTLRCYVDRPVTVECEYYPEGSFQTALAEYHLAPRANPEPAAAAFNFDSWMHERTERAHASYMRRTSQPLMQEVRKFTKEDIARFFKVPAHLIV